MGSAGYPAKVRWQPAGKHVIVPTYSRLMIAGHIVDVATKQHLGRMRQAS
jgi:hypothetical protein